jgi:hypothetical protein
VEEERAACAWAILGELLRRHGPEREAGIDEVRGELVCGADASVGDRVEPGPIGVGHAFLQVRECFAFV